jgi:hypothetical protein
MGQVIQVTTWGKKDCPNEAIRKLLSCDQFIRSRFVTPPMGNVVFNFEHGSVTVCGSQTIISGDDCQIIIREKDVQLIGSVEEAIQMFCSIHREIENLDPHAIQSA